MKEFRIAECLDEDGEGVHEYAIFADGSRKKLIQVHEKYGKYFEVDNELNTDDKTFVRFSFTGRVKDAIDTIRSGNGDCISMFQLFGTHESVLYFIDREKGEDIRQQTLAGWKDATFGWMIRCGNKNSFSGYSILNTKGERISALSENRTFMTFDTREAAENHVKGLIEKAGQYAKKFAEKFSGTEIEEERSKLFHTMMDEIEQDTGTEFSVVLDFALDMLSGNLALKSPECIPDEMGYSIHQCSI